MCDQEPEILCQPSQSPSMSFEPKELQKPEDRLYVESQEPVEALEEARKVAT